MKSLPLLLALALLPLTAPVALAEQGRIQVAQAGPSLTEKVARLLPAAPSGWTADKTEPAGGALKLYTSAHAQRTYHKGGVEVTVAIGFSSSLNKAIKGSITNTDSLPPASRVAVVARHRAVVGEFQTPKLVSVQIPVPDTAVVILTSRTGSLEDVTQLAEAVDYSDLSLR